MTSRNLTVSEIKNSVFGTIACGNNAEPLRIEEPLKWLLWRMGIIGPLFEYPSEPHYPFPCGRRKKERLLEEHERTKELLQEAFYACETEVNNEDRAGMPL